MRGGRMAVTSVTRDECERRKHATCATRTVSFSSNIACALVFAQFLLHSTNAETQAVVYPTTSPDAQVEEDPTQQMYLFRIGSQCAEDCEARCVRGILPAENASNKTNQIFFICSKLKVRNEFLHSAWMSINGRMFMYVVIGAIVLVVFCGILCALISCAVNSRRRKRDRDTGTRDFDGAESERVRLSAAKSRPIDV